MTKGLWVYCLSPMFSKTCTFLYFFVFFFTCSVFGTISFPLPSCHYFTILFFYFTISIMAQLLSFILTRTISGFLALISLSHCQVLTAITFFPFNFDLNISLNRRRYSLLKLFLHFFLFDLNSFQYLKYITNFVNVFHLLLIWQSNTICYNSFSSLHSKYSALLYSKLHTNAQPVPGSVWFVLLASNLKSSINSNDSI